MKTITLLSMNGGTGRTSLVANLVSLLRMEGRRCLALDLDPQNLLGLHFGARQGMRAGLSQIGLGQDPWDLAAHLNHAEVTLGCVPFGFCSDGELMKLETKLSKEGRWLSRQLSEVGPASDLAVLDTPPGRTIWARQALASADLALVVLRADAASYATLPTVEMFLRETGMNADRVHFIVNQFDSRKSLSRDMLAALKGVRGDRLLPFTIPYDEQIRESFAERSTLPARNVSSRVLDILRELATWITGRLASDLERTTPELATAHEVPRRPEITRAGASAGAAVRP